VTGTGCASPAVLETSGHTTAVGALGALFCLGCALRALVTCGYVLYMLMRWRLWSCCSRLVFGGQCGNWWAMGVIICGFF